MELAFIFFMTMLVIATLSQRLVKIERDLASLPLLDIKLDLLLRHAGIEYDPYKDMAPPVAAALRGAKDKFQAIKRYREATGGSLRQAKKVIEEAIGKARITL